MELKEHDLTNEMSIDNDNKMKNIKDYLMEELEFMKKYNPYYLSFLAPDRVLDEVNEMGKETERYIYEDMSFNDILATISIDNIPIMDYTLFETAWEYREYIDETLKDDAYDKEGGITGLLRESYYKRNYDYLMDIGEALGTNIIIERAIKEINNKYYYPEFNNLIKETKNIKREDILETIKENSTLFINKSEIPITDDFGSNIVPDSIKEQKK